MGFFVASVGPGNAGNLGGLAGADQHCQTLATAAGAGNRTWRAYLSTQATGGQPAVNARDRIGSGPWYNAANFMIARDVADLHGDAPPSSHTGNNITKFTALSEKGEVIAGMTDDRTKLAGVRHDIMTGSQPDGRAYTDSADHTCSNWTSNAEGVGSVQVGHSDRAGFGNASWNSSHGTRGCSKANLAAPGGDGLFYCFAAN